MSGTGQRRSTRRAPATGAAPAGVPAGVPAVVSARAPTEPTAELLEERTSSFTGGRPGRSLGRSLPGAVAGTLLVVALAFGAALGPGGALGPASDRGQSGDTAVEDGSSGGGHEGSLGGGDADKGDGYQGNTDGGNDEYEWAGGPDATDKPDESGGEPDPTNKPDAEPTEKPQATPKPTERPDPTNPPSDAIALGLAIKESHPFMDWGSCEGLDFDYYKVVRSKDSTASWPTGEGDEMIAAVERGGTRKAYDTYVPHGVRVWYRVFCVRKGEDGYKVVNASATKGIEVPDEPVPPTPPDPITLELGATIGDGGKVLLDWSACSVDGFAFYKVLRSTTTNDPSYLPWHDGTEVVGVVSEADATQLQVPGPDAGTAWYRVQCIGYVGDQKVLLGESAVVAVTVP